MRLFILWACLCSALLADNYGTLNVSRLESVYDGDTITVDIEGLHPLIGEDIKVRLRGIDAPEIRTKDPQEKAAAKKAKAFLGGLLMKARSVQLRNVSRGKYFRIVADLYIDGENAADKLLAAKLVKVYSMR